MKQSNDPSKTSCCDSEPNASSCCAVSSCCWLTQWPGKTWAVVLLRLFLGLLFLNAGLGKFIAKTDQGPQLSFEAYKAVSNGIYQKFQAETFLPSILLAPYTYVLPWAELLLGLAVLVGFRTKASLALMGLMCISLAFGQMLIGGHETVFQISVYVLLVAMALAFVKHNALAIKD